MPTATASPPATSTPAPQLLLEDSFDNNLNSWVVGPRRASDAEIVGGAMVVTMTQLNRVATFDTSLSVADVDQTVEASIVAKPGQPVEAEYGLVCRDGPLGWYSFEVNATGMFGIWRYSKGAWTSLAIGDSQGVVLPAPDVNEIRAVCASSRLTLIANGQVLAIVQDDTLPQGYPGLTVDSGNRGRVTVRFDNLRILTPDERFYARRVQFTGGRLLYGLKATGAKRYELVTADSDGSHLVQLTSGTNGQIVAAAWSPDGQKIVYAWQAGNARNFDLYVIAADGSGQTALTKNGSTESADSVAWSPDGKQIAYGLYSAAGGTGTHDIYVMQADGSNPHALTRSGFAAYPAWSPNGTQIAYIWLGNNKNAEIHVMASDGSHDVNLTLDPAREQISNFSAPAWSPDSQRLAFVSTLSGNPEIYVTQADGSQQTRLTYFPGADISPSWSPDGQYILFASNRGVDHSIFHLYVMNADGSGYTALASADGSADLPRLRP
jgi:Tol biopolymer transport system component